MNDNFGQEINHFMTEMERLKDQRFGLTGGYRYEDLFSAGEKDKERNQFIRNMLSFAYGFKMLAAAMGLVQSQSHKSDPLVTNCKALDVAFARAVLEIFYLARINKVKLAHTMRAILEQERSAGYKRDA